MNRSINLICGGIIHIRITNPDKDTSRECDKIIISSTNIEGIIHIADNKFATHKDNLQNGEYVVVIVEDNNGNVIYRLDSRNKEHNHNNIMI